jgi:phage pi2 protein 07
MTNILINKKEYQRFIELSNKSFMEWGLDDYNFFKRFIKNSKKQLATTEGVTK